MVKKLFLLAVLICCFVSAEIVFAQGGPNPLFFSANPTGLERLEFRTGKNAAQDWEIGLGFNTQASGKFVTANVYDPSWWTIGTTYNFTYGINASGVATFSMVVNPSQTINLTWGSGSSGKPDDKPMLLGNALQIHAKRDVDVTFGGISLSGNPGDPWGVDYGYLNVDPLAGFSYNGTIKFRALGSGSSQGVLITAGTVIPEPGTILLLGSGFLGLGIIGYFRRKKA